MKRGLVLALTVSTLLMFTACGSDSKNNSTTKSTVQKLKEAEYLVVVYEVDIEGCKVSSLKENISGGQFGNFFELDRTINKETLVSEFNNTNNIDCSTFDRATDGKCGQYDFSEFSGLSTNHSCTVGFDTK